jgi:hypothetical protein
LIWAHLAWDYFHGGVPTHHILHSADLPGISNWWGGIVLPSLTWYLLYRIHHKIVRDEKSGIPPNMAVTIFRFTGALFFGILISFFFTLGSDLPGYMMIGLILISFFVPLYWPEYLLGYVIGMAYTFGAILPIGFGILFMIIFTIAHKFVRAGILYLVSKARIT